MASRARRRRTRKRPRRWLALLTALGAAGAAFWLLMAGDPDSPLGEIDAASRQELERVLETAEGARSP
ncbi:MAG: hypothetical protein VX546_07450 [Myxococcota bacterium]|nr:hypothetical protein [Myxococcota bacterium]